MKVLLLHLDLGIGGAERLMVNLSLAMQELGHDVKIFTSHHDPQRCFQETTGGGRLGKAIEVYGDWLPRQIFGKLTAFCAILRMISLAIAAAVTNFCPDVVVLDGVSAPIPLLKIAGFPVLFYCHYPDKLLCVDRSSSLKRLYRLPLDLLEESTTASADCIVVNSKFTAAAFKAAFTFLGKIYCPKVLYPSIDMPASIEKPSDTLSYLEGASIVFVSLNRYERKKNIALALLAFSQLLEKMKEMKFATKTVRLVIAGGYDSRVQENIEYHEELVKISNDCSITPLVVFRRSIDDQERTELLRRASALLYTPPNEHFGIVPLEAMSLGTPVIAVNNGGPLETVLHNVTGYLCEESPEGFMEAMLKIATDKRTKSLGPNGIRHEKFTNEVMRSQLESYLQETVATRQDAWSWIRSFLVCGILVVLGLLLRRFLPPSLSPSPA